MRIRFVRINKMENIDDGFTIIENYNETLDSATVRISHLEDELDIEPLDDVELRDENNAIYKYFCIDNFQCIQEAIGQVDTTYSYTINLCSQTKKMEGIVLPNLSITPRKKSSKKNISAYLLQYLRLYGPKIRVESPEPGYVDLWEFDNTVWDKFDNVEAPEMQWSNPTFREVITDLMMIRDCIPILRNNVISFLDLTEVNEVDKPYNYIQKSMASDDYVSEIRMDLQNVMQTSIEGINNVVSTTEYLTFTSDDAIVTSDNCYLKTQFPILNVKHLWIIVGAAIKDGNNFYTVFLKEDLCNIGTLWNSEQPVYSLVYEKKEYDSKEILYRKQIDAPLNLGSKTIQNYYSKVQNYCLYYERNSNRIEGFSRVSKPYLGSEFITLEAIKGICARNGIYNNYIDVYGFNGINGDTSLFRSNNGYFSTFFQIEYETTYNTVFSASKSDKPHNNRVIIDNQTNAWVDAYSQGFLEYQKVNRLGNLQKMYNQRVDNTNDLFEIKDKIGDDIVYRTEYQFYPEHVECNAQTTKNYVLRNYFTGIKSKIRTWVNAKEEAFERHDLKKYYCGFSYNRGNEIVESINNGKALASYLISPLKYNSAIDCINYVLIRTKKGTSYWPSNESKFALNCVVRLIGNSIVLTAGFEDNWIVNKKINIADSRDGSYQDTGIVIESDIKEPKSTTISERTAYVPPAIEYWTGISDPAVGGITTQVNRYCDDDGEFETVQFYFLDEFKSSNVEVETSGGQYSISDVRDMYSGFFNLPVVVDSVDGTNPLNPYKFGVEMNLYKDNKEKPVVSTQFEFRSEETDIAFTKYFLQKEDIIRNATNGFKKMYLSYILDKEKVPATKLTAYGYLAYNNSGNDNEYSASVDYVGTLPSSGEQQYKYLYVCDESDNLMLVFDASKTLYLNIRRYL